MEEVVTITKAPAAVATTPITTPTTSTSPTSSAASAAAAAAARRKYAAEDDWKRHRDTISTLYKQKRLKDVMSFMEREYGFFATERMYKARFKEWGVGKNVTAVEVQHLMQKLEQGKTKNEVLAASDRVDVSRIQRYVKRKPAGLRKLRQQQESHARHPLDVLRALAQEEPKRRCPPYDPVRRIMHPRPIIMRAPEQLELPDEILRQLRTFMDGCYGPGVPANLRQLDGDFQWLVGRDELMLDFVLKFRLAHNLIDEGYTRQGFQALNLCFDRLRLFLQEGRPILLLYILSSALEASEHFGRPEVLQMLFRHMAALAENTLGKSHPTSEIARRLGALDQREQKQMLKLTRQFAQGQFGPADDKCKEGSTSPGGVPPNEPAFHIYSRTLEIASIGLNNHINHNSNSSSKSPVEGKPDAAAAAGAGAAGDDDFGLAGFRAMLADLAMASCGETLAFWVQMRIAIALYDLGRYQEVEDFLEREHPAAFDLGRKVPDRVTLMLKCFIVRASLKVQDGEWAAAEKLMGEATSLADLTWGREDAVTKKMKTKLGDLVQERLRMQPCY